MDTMLGLAVLLVITMVASVVAVALESVCLRAAFALMPQAKTSRSVVPPIERDAPLVVRAYGQPR